MFCLCVRVCLCVCVCVCLRVRFPYRLVGVRGGGGKGLVTTPGFISGRH